MISEQDEHAEQLRLAEQTRQSAITEMTSAAQNSRSFITTCIDPNGGLNFNGHLSGYSDLLALRDWSNRQLRFIEKEKFKVFLE